MLVRKNVTFGRDVSVLFNEPKLLKYVYPGAPAALERRFSALQRAEIAEILITGAWAYATSNEFQCSSTSRNC